MLLAEVIADLATLRPDATIYAEALAPSSRAWVATAAPDAAHRFSYAVGVAAAQAALGRGAVCPWQARSSSRRV